MKPEANATNATATQTPLTKPTATSTKWPTTPIPLSIHNIPTTQIQEVPRSLMWKPQGEVPLIPNQNPTPLQPRAPATASATIAPTRDDTPWPKTVPASTNLFVARSSWPIPPNGNEIPIPALIKMEERTNTENAPQKQAVIPPPSDPR